VLTDGRVVQLRSRRRINVGGAGIFERWARRVLGKREAPVEAARSGAIRVVCITNELNLTGAPLYMMEIVTELKRRGIIEPVVIAALDGPLRAMFEAEGISVRIRQRPLEPGSKLRGTLAVATQALTDELRRIDANVVYANTLESFYAIAAAREAGIPSFWNIHESDPWQDFFEWFSPTVSERTLRDLFATPGQIVFPYEETLSLYADLQTHDNFNVVRNAVDQRRIMRPLLELRASARAALGVATDEVVILTVGTVCERKGQQDLVRAIAMLSPPLQQRVRCFIVGDRSGPYSVELHQMLAQLPAELRERFTVIAETPDTASYYGAADCFVCTSRVESFPRVIMEAMAYGLPIVTTAVFGIRAQVRDGVNGLFYNAGNLQELCDRLGRIIGDKTLRQSLSEGAPRVLAELQTFDEMVGIYGRLLTESTAMKASS
jgi:glycosyltransferase involved in cell wall biosynthesis